jgi:hypothetical protein
MAGAKGQWGAASKAVTGGLSTAGTALTSFGTKIPFVGGLIQSLGGALSSLAGIGLGPLLAIAVAAVGIIGGVTQAFIAGNKAAEIFGTTQEKVTVQQKLAAESAGFLTGILNVLTFGIFRKAIGPTGTLTKKLAEFFNMYPPLMLAVQGLLLNFKIYWGILKGLWYFLKNSFIGLWEGLKAIFVPIVDAVKEIWDVFEPLVNTFGFFNAKAKDTMSIVDVIANTFGFLGKLVGWVFQGLGIVIGWLLKAILRPFIVAMKNLYDPLKELWNTLVEAFDMLWSNIKEGLIPLQDLWTWFSGLFGEFEGGIGFLDILSTTISLLVAAMNPAIHTLTFFITLISNLVKAGMEWFGGIKKVLVGIFTGDIGMIGEGIYQMFVKGFLGIFWGIWDAFRTAVVTAFTSLWDILVGHSIIPDMIKGIIKWFALLPIKIPLMLWKMMGKMGPAIWKGAVGLAKLWLKGAKMFFNALFWHLPIWLGKMFNILSGLFVNALQKVFVDFPIWLHKGFVNALTKIWEWIKTWPGAIKQKAKDVGAGAARGAATVGATGAGAMAGWALGGPVGAGVGGWAGKKLSEWVFGGNKDQEEANKRMVTPGSIYTHDLHTEALLKTLIATQVRPVARTLGDSVHYKAKRGQVGTGPKTTFTEGKGIDKLGKHAAVQVNKLDLMVRHLEEIADALKAGNLTGQGAESETPGTKDRRRPTLVPNYYDMPFHTIAETGPGSQRQTPNV